MAQAIWRNKSLLLASGIFIGIVILIIVTLIAVGGAYKGGLIHISEEAPPRELTLRKKKEIKRITIQGSDTGCIEVTPDGVVRTFATCDGELTDAVRVNDPKFILQLFKRLSEREAAPASQGGTVYTLIIETDEGTETITITIDDEITEIVEIIVNNIPPSASPSPVQSSQAPAPTATPNPFASPSPLTSSAPEPSSSPLPESDNPFICGFSEGSTQQKPYRVSNIVCSNEPQPGN